MNHLRNIGEILLPAIGYGDAMGLPVETMSHQKIRESYGTINGLVRPIHNLYYADNFPAGTTSDDTQFSEAIARALMDNNGFSIESQAAEHLRIYNESSWFRDHKSRLSIRGWGGSTTESMGGLASGISPLESGQKNGAGNGILMKMAPLVFWQAAREIPRSIRYEQYDQLTTMTHDSDAARACTRLHGDVMYWLMNNPESSMERIREYALGFLACTATADPNLHIERALSMPEQDINGLVERYAAEDSKYGFFAPDTLAIAYDVFLAADGDYTRAVIHVANLGGDADSIASIAGSMASARSGGQFIPPADFEKTQDYERLSKLSREFTRQALELN